MSFALPNALLRSLILSVGICATLTVNAAQSAMANANPMLLTAHWELVKWPGHTIPKGIHGEAVTIDFDASTQPAKITGFSGCGQFSGTYASPQPTKLTLSQLRTAPLACPAALLQAETNLLATLRSVDKYRVTNSILQLETAKGQILTFYPREKANAAAKIKYIYVAPYKEYCVGMIPMSCFKIRETNRQPWEFFYDDIVGFDFIPGNSYRLRIVEETIPNPPADGSSIRWTLDQILEVRLAN